MGILDRIRDLFAVENEQVDADEARRFAIALLLAELSRADYRVDESEKRMIVDLLAKRFELTRQQARSLLERAEAKAEKVVSLYDYVQILNAQLDYAERCDVIEMLWQVAYADGRIDTYEEHELRKIADLLYVEDPDFIRAKLRAHGDED